MHQHTRSALVVVALAASISLDQARVLVLAQPPDSGAVELRPGVVVDLSRGVAFVMNPAKGLDAIGIRRGELLWHSDEAAKPLSSTGEVLVAQAEPPRAGTPPAGELLVRVLDARTGRRRHAVTHALPPGARANVIDTVEGSFQVHARTTPTEVTLAWEYQEAPRQGVKPGALDFEVPSSPQARGVREVASAKALSASGRVRINLATGRASVPREEGAAAPKSADLQAGERLASVTGEQFVSADGRHVLASERVADDSAWERYQWTIFDRGTGARLGSLRDYRRHASFIVAGSSIIYETGPVERRIGQELVSEPLRLRAVDLVKGQELWVRPVRDTTYRGPFPP